MLIRFVFLLIASILIAGCSEANFDLSPNSRLPKWFSVPNGMSRKDVKVTLDYYVYPSGREAVFRLFDIKNGRELEKVTGVLKGSEPIKLKNKKSPPGEFAQGRPIYEIVSVGGMTDVIEHREKAPVFYMTDDLAVWRELGL